MLRLPAPRGSTHTFVGDELTTTFGLVSVGNCMLLRECKEVYCVCKLKLGVVAIMNAKLVELLAGKVIIR